MNVFIALGVLQLLLIGADSFGFNKHKDYVHRNMCMYGFDTNSSSPIHFKNGSPKVLNNTAVLYFQLDGENDTVRYVWSFVGTPTLFISVTNVTEERTNCEDSANDLQDFVEKQSPGSAHIPGYDGDFAFNVIFNRLIEFKDKKNKASKAFNACDFHNEEIYRPFNLSDLDWTFNYDKMEVVARDPDFNATNTTDKKKPFTWTIQIRVPTKPGRMSGFPKTLYTVNSTYFDFVFRNFHYKLNDKDDGRLVLELQLVHGMLTPGKLEHKFSRDDEYTPSVFITNNQLFGDEERGGYLQWKPISYLSRKRKSTQSQQALSNDKCKPNVTLNDGVGPGLVLALYGENSTEAGAIVPMYMVFGTEGDDNNPQPSYVSWTGLLGFGTPPQDSISFVVILTICIGLGVPALIIGLGGVFLVIRRKPWKRLMGASNESKGYKKLDINDNSEK